MELSDIISKLNLYILENSLCISPDLLVEIAAIIHSGYENNGFLHLARIFVFNNRIISIPELFHLMHTDSVLGTRMTRKVLSFNHPIYIKSLSDNQILACMFTSQAMTRLNGLGTIYNIPIHGNIFLYSSGIFITSSFNFFTYFYIFNDINYLPSEISIHNLNYIASESFHAYQQIYDGVNHYYTYDRGAYSFIKKSTSVLPESVKREIENFNNSMANGTYFDREVERTLRNFSDYKHYDFIRREVVAESRRLLD